MTTGELVFYSGVGLLAFTVLLAVIFLIKRPKYVPESLSHIPDGTGGTQKLRSGYPTETMTHERVSGGAAAPSTPGRAVSPQPAAPDGEGTVPLEQGTAPLEQGTAPLRENGSTELLSGGRSRRG